MNDPCTDRKVNLIMRRDQNKVKGRFNVQRQGTYGRRDGREGRRKATMLDGGIPIRKLIRIQINIDTGGMEGFRVYTECRFKLEDRDKY